MKALHKFFAFATLIVAAIIFAGCSETDSGSGSSTKPAESGSESGEADADENASIQPKEGFQLVSLEVPNMSS